MNEYRQIKLNIILVTFFTLCFSLFPNNSQADVLRMPDMLTSEELPGLPQNGLTQQQVRQQHGSPLKEHPAIGDPPITRWDYQDYSVFFENKLVITAVQKPEPGT
ncbi:MAG: hypothetical protein L3J24_01585 [Xanthomonadales bacterium]|nr:hypothetical protein [Xanthomonadales bacterium]